MTKVKRENIDAPEAVASSNKKRKTAEAATTTVPAEPLTYFDLLDETVLVSSAQPSYTVADAEPSHTATVHRELLKRQSHWFEHRLRDDEVDELDLDISGHMLKTFVVWLYTGRLINDTKCHVPAAAVKPLHDEDEVSESGSWRDAWLARFYCFAHKHSIRHLKNDIITTLIAQNCKYNNFGEAEAVRIVSQEVPKSGLSRYYIDERVRDGMLPGHMPKDLEKWPPAFLAGMLRKEAERVEREKRGEKTPTLTVRDACNYHDHQGISEEKAACQKKLNTLPVFLH